MANSSDRPLAIIAGGGSVPFHVANAALAAGRKVLVVGIEGEADTAIETLPHDWFNWGQIGRLEKLIADHGAGDVVLIGAVRIRPTFRSLKLDLGTVRALPEILSFIRSGDNTVLTGAIKMIEARGYKVVGAHEIAPDLVAEAGLVAGKPPRQVDLDDAHAAMAAARGIGILDIGQAAVAVEGRVVALEGAEGTDGMLKRVAELRRSGRLRVAGRAGVLAKCAKPQQDMRVDMPTIGPQTITEADAAGLAGIAVDAGWVMIVEREETVRRAVAAGLFLVAIDDKGAAP